MFEIFIATPIVSHLILPRFEKPSLPIPNADLICTSSLPHCHARPTCRPPPSLLFGPRTRSHSFHPSDPGVEQMSDPSSYPRCCPFENYVCCDGGYFCGATLADCPIVINKDEINAKELEQECEGEVYNFYFTIVKNYGNLWINGEPDVIESGEKDANQEAM